MPVSGRIALRCALSAAIFSVSSSALAQEFGYFGEIGPAFWGELSPAWETCGSGDIQSPVKLTPGKDLSSKKLQITYGVTAGEIFNNGHTIEIETEGNNTLMLQGIVYELVQFHFHTPSEHRVGSKRSSKGRGYDMELHLVHRAGDGTNAVIGVFLKRGKSSNALEPIFASLPDDLNVKHPLDELFNPADFLPRDTTQFRYIGSLTTPPCTEGVKWVVFTQPVTVSDEDIAQFAERIHFNARYVQRAL
jgi:carbonic anhydrase